MKDASSLHASPARWWMTFSASPNLHRKHTHHTILKTPRPFLTGLSFALAFLLSPAGLHGQGALVPPPGAPAPTMKTLDQVEARTIVNATNTPGDAANTFIISVPGSYYLTGNITGALSKHGISVQANDVTLDLNGFALTSGGGGFFSGVHVPLAQSGIRIRNGSVRGWREAGVWAGLAVTQAENLCLTGNTAGYGLYVGNGSLARDCVASGNWDGFYLGDRTQISTCIATENTGIGFDCAAYVTIIDCTASRNFGTAGIRTLGSCSIIRCSATRNIPLGTGINAGSGCTIVDCTASNNADHGIGVSLGSTVRSCTANANGNYGIIASGSCHVISNTCLGNVRGIGAIATKSRVEENNCLSNSDAGVFVLGTGNLVIRNSASGNGRNYDVGSAGNVVGPIVDMTAGGTITSTSPWANFIH